MSYRNDQLKLKNNNHSIKKSLSYTSTVPLHTHMHTHLHAHNLPLIFVNNHRMEWNQMLPSCYYVANYHESHRL